MEQKSPKDDLGLPLSYLEFLDTKKLTLHKDGGLNDISPNAIKAPNEENRRTLFDICRNYFNGEINIKEWQRGSLKILPKRETILTHIIGEG